VGGLSHYILKMDIPHVMLAPTAVDLGADLRAVLGHLHRCGLRAVQLTASGPRGLRPRSLDASARRDLAATLRRHELLASGVDLWIPPEDLIAPETVDRVLDAISGSMDLLRDLGAAAAASAAVTVPWPEDGTVAAEVASECVRRSVASGIRLAVMTPAEIPTGMVRAVDPPAWWRAGGDPIAAVADRAAAPRLCDEVAGVRSAPGPGGRLDVTAYRIACEVADAHRPVVADLRGLQPAGVALTSMRAAWGG